MDWLIPRSHCRFGARFAANDGKSTSEQGARCNRHRIIAAQRIDHNPGESRNIDGIGKAEVVGDGHDAERRNGNRVITFSAIDDHRTTEHCRGFKVLVASTQQCGAACGERVNGARSRCESRCDLGVVGRHVQDVTRLA